MLPILSKLRGCFCVQVKQQRYSPIHSTEECVSEGKQRTPSFHYGTERYREHCETLLIVPKQQFLSFMAVI